VIERDVTDGIVTLRLAHGKASAMDVELLAAMSAEIDAAADARAVVLTGTGPIFSAGVDLFRLTNEGEPYVRRFFPLLTDLIRRLFTFPAPLVVAANGHAIAGGGLMVMCGDQRLMAQLADGVAACRAAVDINIAASLGMLTAEQVGQLSALGIHRYNHNLETARSHFPQVVTTHTWEERWDTLRMVREAGMEVCCGGILGMGESVEQRAEFAANLAALEPDEVPLNFFNPRPGTPFGDLDVLPASEALKSVAAFRLALPRTILRFAGGREITLGDLGAKQGMLGGINAVIVGFKTFGRSNVNALQNNGKGVLWTPIAVSFQSMSWRPSKPLISSVRCL
jgi:hypothetical protein